MLPTWLMAMLVVLHEAWSARRSRQIRFLQLQIELLRQKAPGNRVTGWHAATGNADA